MIGETAQLAVELKLKDQGFSAAVGRDEASLKKLNTTVGKTGGAFSAVAKHIGGFQKNIGNAFGNVGKGASNAAKNIEKLAFAAGALAVGGGIAAIKWAGEFEAQLNTINTIARETPEGLSKIGDTIRQIARDSGTPLEELTQGYYDLLSAGIKAADAPKVLAEANKLAIGGLASAAETVDLLTTAINVYGGDASQAARFTDEFAKAIERGKVTAAELAGSYAQVAPLAKSLGVENKELAAGYATLTAAGTPAAEAATQMASALTALLKKTPGLEHLEKVTKKNYAAIAGSQGLNAAFAQMRVDADKAGIELIDLIGRKEALLYILQTTGPNQKKYNADLLAMGDAAGTAAAQMAERQQGLNFELKVLKAGVRDAGIEIGSALLPKLTPLIGKLNTFLQGNREGIKKFGADLANAFETAAEWISRIDFSQIAESLKVAGFFAKGLITSFLAAPQWLQTAVLTGWGLNKLTGGAVQNIMADLTKAVIGGAMQQFVARGATPANPLFVADVTGGLAGKAGGAAGGLGLVSKMFLVGEAIGLGLIINEVRNNMAAQNTQKASEIAQTQIQWLKQQPSKADLETGLAAVEKGINDIQANPLNVLVQGDALDYLKQMRTDIKTQLAAQAIHANVKTGSEVLGPPIPDLKGSRMLGPWDPAKIAAVLERGRAKGFKPTITAAEATLGRNLLRAQENARLAVLKAGRDTFSELVRIRMAVLAAGSFVPAIIYSGNTGQGTPSKRPAGASTPRATEDRGAMITVKAVASTRDISTASTVKTRFGPTIAQAGGI